MKKILMIVGNLLLPVIFYLLPASAQTASELFVLMPEDKTPLLTLNDKKEMVECWNQHLDTSVKNKLGGTSYIDTLSTDYLKVHISDAESLILFKTLDGKVGLVNTLYSPQGESTLEWYDTTMKPIGKTISPSEPLKPSDTFTLIEYLVDPQTKEITVKYNHPLEGEQVDK